MPGKARLRREGGRHPPEGGWRASVRDLSEELFLPAETGGVQLESAGT